MKVRVTTAALTAIAIATGVHLAPTTASAATHTAAGPTEFTVDTTTDAA
ncbi:hypothetical protein H4N64_43960, partial [Streptomyces sp. PSKA01]|nr:hypothetical protein [Streptomyces cupreus]